MTRLIHEGIVVSLVAEKDTGTRSVIDNRRKTNTTGLGHSVRKGESCVLPSPQRTIARESAVQVNKTMHVNVVKNIGALLTTQTS